ncbi:MAG: cytidine deaminase [Mycoplasmataceae bacterium]|jgi:cytidine deaminase|nr:cytidine deaminase [Mycoplasmataceae bacterium]
MKPTFKELKELLKNSYAPYSKFETAAIVETDKGNFKGVNVENASYPNGICAERNAIFNAVTHGAEKFKSLYLISSSKRNDITPCGMCRQVMVELFNTSAKIICFNVLGKSRTYTLNQLLPYFFKKEQLK